MDPKAQMAQIIMASASTILSGLLANGEGNRRGISDAQLTELALKLAIKLAGGVADEVNPLPPASSDGH